jgi:hypothetical protein
MKVISGGQTGIDRLGLEVAKHLDIETGGRAPKFYWTEDGPDETLKDFGLIEDETRGYLARTIHNVHNSTGTVLFGNMSSAGSVQTINFCKRYQKPYIINPNATELQFFILTNKIEILNVAGNRGSKLTQEQLSKYRAVLLEALSNF